MKPAPTAGEGFGTSAVDLFASGMGAFILIALIFMVMYSATPAKVVTAPPTPACPEPVQCPDAPECPVCPACAACEVCEECAAPLTCPDPQPVPDCPVCPQVAQPSCPDPVTCPVCPICPDAPRPQPPTAPPAPDCPEPKATAPTKPLPDVDIVFVLDTTGSMRYVIESMKRELSAVVEVLEQVMPSVAIGVITVNDRRQKPVHKVHALRRLTGDRDAADDLHRFLRGIDAGKAVGINNDRPEAFMTGLQLATAIKYRADVANRVVIVITDSYAYEDEAERSLAIARSFAANEGSRVSTVHLESGKFPEADEYLPALAKAGGGEYVIDRGTVLANVLLSVL